MHVLARSLLVVVLLFGVSGASSLVASEPCSASETNAADTSCAPTCVTCGCCHQAAVTAALVPAPSRRLAIATEHPAYVAHAVTCASRDVLHVPRPARP